MNAVERVVEPIINCIQRIAREYEDDNSDIRISLVLDKEQGNYQIGYRSGVGDDDDEHMFAAPLEDIRFLEEEIVLAAKKFAVLCPLISIIIATSDDQVLFSTFGKTLQEKVAEFHDVSWRDIFVVNANHEGCEIEICFFVAQSEKSRDKTQMIFTTDYFNSVATEMLVMKMLEGEDEHRFLELVGFIGKLSDDNYTRVERAVDVVFRIFMKRLKQMKHNLEHIEDIDLFISDPREPSEPMKRKSEFLLISKPSSGRYSFRSRSQHAVVDLTADEERKEKAAFVLTDEVDDDTLYELACSEIQEDSIHDDFFDTETLSLMQGWDQRVDERLFLGQPYDQPLFNDWVAALHDSEQAHDDFYEEGFLSATTSARTPSPARPKKISDEVCRAKSPDGTEELNIPEGSAFDAYEQRAAGSSSSLLRQIPNSRPQLGRGLNPNESVELKAKPHIRKSNLFSDDEMEKFSPKQKRPSSPRTSFITQSLFDKTTTEEKTLPSDYKIPKRKSTSPDNWVPKRSVLNPSPYSRRPIHTNTQSSFMNNPNPIEKPQRSDKMLQRLNLPFASPTPRRPPGHVRPPANVRPSELPKFSTKKPADDDDDDVILVDDEAENEPNRNDQNNNHNGKRRLMDIEEAPEAANSYKFFKSKGNPNFKRFDGTQN